MQDATLDELEAMDDATLEAALEAMGGEVPPSHRDRRIDPYLKWLQAQGPQVYEAAWRAAFGQRVREAREAKGMTVTELTRAIFDNGLDVGDAWVMRVELGEQMPTISEAVAVSKALGTDLDPLVDAFKMPEGD